MIIQWAMAIENYIENSKLNEAPLKLTTRVAKAHPRTNCQDQYYLDIMTLKIQIREFFQKYHQQGSHILHCCLNFGFQCLELCLEQLNSLVVFIGMSCRVYGLSISLPVHIICLEMFILEFSGALLSTHLLQSKMAPTYP